MKFPKNRFELTHLYMSDGWWVAVLYNRLCGYSKYLQFDATKKETIYSLRHDYGVKVGREFC